MVGVTVRRPGSWHREAHVTSAWLPAAHRQLHRQGRAQLRPRNKGGVANRFVSE